MNNRPSLYPASRSRREHGLLLVLALAAGLCSAVVFADDDDEHRGREHEHRGNHYSDGYRHREWRGEDRDYGYRPIYPQPYVYAQPVYVPPPVYYAPRQSPGISLFFPLDLR